MAGPLSDDEVLEAVARQTGRPGDGGRPLRSGPDIRRVPFLDLRVVRSIETCETKLVTRPGHHDMSGRTPYEGDLDLHHVDPPKDPNRRWTTELMLKGSAHEVRCGCDGGRRPCKRCRAKGTVACDLGPDCPACKGVDPCTWCDGTGRRASGRKPVAATQGAPSAGPPRTTCVKCRKPRTACAACKGRGAIRCPRCDDKGLRACPQCDGERSHVHEACAGTGVLTRWTGGFITHAPDSTPLKLPDSPPPLRVAAAPHAAARGSGPRCAARTPPCPELDPSHRKRIGSTLAIRDGEVAREVGIAWLKAAEVVLPDAPDRVYYVIPGHTAPEVVPLWSRRRSLRVAALAAAVAVVCVLVLTLV